MLSLSSHFPDVETEAQSSPAVSPLAHHKRTGCAQSVLVVFLGSGSSVRIWKWGSRLGAAAEVMTLLMVRKPVPEEELRPLADFLGGMLYVCRTIC